MTIPLHQILVRRRFLQTVVTHATLKNQMVQKWQEGQRRSSITLTKKLTRERYFTCQQLILQPIVTDVLFVNCAWMYAPIRRCKKESTDKYRHIYIYTLRCISINEIFDFCSKEFCKALPGFHAFTGCDNTASFNQKGKSRSLKLLKKNENLQRLFLKLSNWDNIKDLDITILESFVCVLYGKRNHTSIDEAHFEMFRTKYKPKKNNDCLISYMKNIDASSMPPCSKCYFKRLNEQVKSQDYGRMLHKS